MIDLHELCAIALNWTRSEAQSVSLRSMRDLLRTAPDCLEKTEALKCIEQLERTGKVVLGSKG